MADSSVAVTPGSGANIDTRTVENGDERQVIVIGGDTTAANIAPVDATAGLKVDLGADNDVTVTGTVTANAGTGTFTVDLGANNDVTIDGSTVVQTVGAVAGATDTGFAAIAVRNDTLADLAGADGDYTYVQVDSVGGLWIAQAQMGEVQATPTANTLLGRLKTIEDDLEAAQTASIPAGANLIGNVGIGVRTSGGTTLYKNIDVDESEDAVKATAGQVYWIHAVNLSSGVRYLKLYDATVATVVVGTTVPDLTFPIPTQGDTNGAGFTISIPNGIAFATAITIAATTGVADNDSGAPGANEVIVNLGYA